MKSRIFLSVVATLFAIGATLATNIAKSSTLSVNVTANTSTCPSAGTCDQSSQDLCKQNSTTQLFIISGVTCSVQATGRFSQ